MTIGARAWVVWWAATIVILTVLDAPVLTATVAGAVLYVASAFELPGGDGRAYRVMLKVGLALLAVRVVLFGLAGHTGPTTVAMLPELRLPALLGGFSLGGRITGEVLAQEAAEGLRVAAVLLACGALVSVVPLSSLLRLLPVRLRSARLVLQIAVTFVPHLVLQIRAVREAYRMRGNRARGLRAFRAIAGPVVTGAIERSFDLAASMEARGYGAATPTRRAAERSTALDRALMSVSCATAVAAVALRGAPGATWYAYPVVSLPAVDVRALVIAAAVASPVAIAAVARRRLVRASAAQPVHVPLPEVTA